MATDSSNANFDICLATELLRTRRTLARTKVVSVTYRGRRLLSPRKPGLQVKAIIDLLGRRYFFIVGDVWEGNLINIHEDLSPDAHWRNNILCLYSQTKTVLEGQEKCVSKEA